MFGFCAKCFDRSPAGVPPRASEVITPLPRRVQLGVGSGGGKRKKRDEAIQTVHYRGAIPRQHYGNLWNSGDNSTAERSKIRTNRIVEFPYLYPERMDAGEVFSKQFPYVYSNIGDNIVVSSRTFPYLYDFIHSHN